MKLLALLVLLAQPGHCKVRAMAIKHTAYATFVAICRYPTTHRGLLFHRLTQTPVSPPGWPSLPFPFSTAVVSFGGIVHISGMQGYDFMAKPPALVKGGIVNETQQAMSNIQAVMKAARNATMDDVLECMVLLTDIGDFDAFNKVYATFFPGPVKPARVASQGVLVGPAAVEIKCTGDVSQYAVQAAVAPPRAPWLRLPTALREAFHRP